MVIAIDGPSGSGKTTTAKMVSKELGFYYCDSGSLYRAVTYFLLDRKVDLNDDAQIKIEIKDISLKYDLKSNKILINNQDVTSELRTVRVAESVSLVSSKKDVRDRLIDIQRNLATESDIVLDGRDIGTTVFPNADYKFFLSAEIDIRAQRRYDELSEDQKSEISYSDICSMIEERDKIDCNRKHSPLVKASDAVSVDTTHLTLDEQVKKLVNFIKTN
jgi:cytidylate kinase